METKTCTICKENKSKSEFEGNRNTCKRCRNSQKVSASYIAYQINPTKHLEYVKNRRKSHPSRFILYDSQKSDKKKGLDNDLTNEFIEAQISKCCSYCGETKLRMTLDRIDNTIGHLQSNVIPACIRCNYARGAMPYEAWLCLVPGLIKARKKGLFNDWTGRIK